MSFRSSKQRLLNVPQAKLKLRGDRAFAVAASKLWNSYRFLLEPPLDKMSLQPNSNPTFRLWLLSVVNCAVSVLLCAVIYLALSANVVDI